jgi:uncharacterized protein (TIGR02117 family)
MKFIKSIFSFAGYTVLSVLFLVLLYLVVAVLFTVIPSNMFSMQPEKGIAIYIKSNGVHTDLVLPTENNFYNWNEKILLEDFAPDTVDYQWTAFGWGDKGFYLDTPNWADLKISTAINAMIPPSPTAMHVSLYGNYIKENKLTKKIILTEEQYLILCQYVFNSFQKDKDGKFILIKNYHYSGANDNFYEAEGDYHLFNTCNNWANSALKTTGVKTALWAPFDKCIFYHF